MRLVAVEIQNFRNITNLQRIEIEADVTGLVGKNESGKTTVLKALHRLNPANQISAEFDLTTEYPRWKLAADRRKNAHLDQTIPVAGIFELTADEVREISDGMGMTIPDDTQCRAERSYANELQIRLLADFSKCLKVCLNDSSVSDDDRAVLGSFSTFEELTTAADELAKQYRAEKATGKANSVKKLITELTSMRVLFDHSLEDDQTTEVLEQKLPRFFYFSSYSNLPGECNLSQLAAKYSKGGALKDEEQTVVSLLQRAGVKPSDLLDDDYESRSAELQAVGWDLSSEVFKYWTQNQDLEVILNLDSVETHDTNKVLTGTERILKIELSDGRHGGVRTNFSTRSTGFQWFFSFFSAFSQYQDSGDSIVVLLDEPGTSLHGEAQKDFLNFIYDELGSHSQTLYTTHSQFMVDPAKYENLRAVHDTSSRSNQQGGVVVTDISLSADKDTVLPVESSLGYSISQHLFIGSGHHLAVEGSSDFVYIQRMSEYLVGKGREGLDPRFSIIPVGGIDNMPAFVALLGRRLKVSALIDGATSSRAAERIRKAAEANGVSRDAIVVCSETDSTLPSTADIEDLLAEKDYLRLYEYAFRNPVGITLPPSGEPILRRIELQVGKFDHALPAHALTDNREEFFETVDKVSLDRFENLFKSLNQTL